MSNVSSDILVVNKTKKRKRTMLKVVVQNNILGRYNVTRIGMAGLFIGNNKTITNKDGQLQNF